jgi:hypothetical protein
MPWNWLEVVKALVPVVPTALVSGFVGARIKAHFDRAKPSASISGCRIARGRDLFVSPIDVPAQLTDRLRYLKWVKPLSGTVVAAVLEEELESLRATTARARGAIPFVQEKLRELPSVAVSSPEDKRKFLDRILRREVSIIDASFTGGLVRQDLTLSLPSEAELQTLPRIFEYSEATGEDNGGFYLDLRTKQYHVIYRRDRSENSKLLPLVKAFSVFHVDSIRAVLEYVLRDLTTLAAHGDALVEEVEKVLDAGRHLIVELSVTNRGRSAAIFSQWALLRLLVEQVGRDSEIPLVRTNPVWKPEDPVQVLAQEEALRALGEPLSASREGFVLEGDSAIKLMFRSEEAMHVLERRLPKIRAVFAMDCFPCQAGLRRADRERPKAAWIFTPRATFGVRGEQFPSDEISQMRKRWSRG